MGQCSAWQTHLDYCKEGHRSDLFHIVACPFDGHCRLVLVQTILEIAGVFVYESNTTNGTQLSQTGSLWKKDRPRRSTHNSLFFFS